MRPDNSYAAYTSAFLGIILISMGIYFIMQAKGFPFPPVILYSLGALFILYGLFRFLPNLMKILNNFKK
jgi:peptidoglycan/LPS O-acetylase OafA/YrhL